LVYLTYLGGTRSDTGSGIAVDAAGNAYVAGNTGGDFPTLNARQPTYGGGIGDGFVAKVSPGGTLVYSTYLGGSDSDSAKAIAVTVYAGGSGNNLFKSTDGGRSWATIAADTSVRATVSSLAFDPLHAQSLYAGVYSTIARTQDGGATWAYGGPSNVVAIAVYPV